MKQPSCVLWALTRAHSAFRHQPKGARTRGEAWSSDPLNLTGLHNASAQGFTNDAAIGLTANKGESKSKKGFRREYVLRVAHKSYHKTNRANKNAAAGLHHSTQVIKRGTRAAAKTIQGLTFANANKKALLLKRLGRLHGATRDITKNAPKK